MRSELASDFAGDPDDDTYEMVCKCGATNCRKTIRGQDWRRRDLQQKYGNYISWHLLEKIKKESEQNAKR
jgi:hypothetical protein